MSDVCNEAWSVAPDRSSRHSAGEDSHLWFAEREWIRWHPGRRALRRVLTDGRVWQTSCFKLTFYDSRMLFVRALSFSVNRSEFHRCGRKSGGRRRMATAGMSPLSLVIVITLSYLPGMCVVKQSAYYEILSWRCRIRSVTQRRDRKTCLSKLSTNVRTSSCSW